MTITNNYASRRRTCTDPKMSSQSSRDPDWSANDDDGKEEALDYAAWLATVPAPAQEPESPTPAASPEDPAAPVSATPQCERVRSDHPASLRFAAVLETARATGEFDHCSPASFNSVHWRPPEAPEPWMREEEKERE